MRTYQPVNNHEDLLGSFTVFWRRSALIAATPEGA